ncbi:hypothetical protein RJ639_025631 [Escallonia herrerae]|uniref:Uncharacterized protein n=1 Tax=Escallonia herrerae TaxID=1293975 RepID=A0AA89ABQ6_9ASTE|nr:hypothetical protein RJ639_025631 [Escallonia herrerae]
MPLQHTWLRQEVSRPPERQPCKLKTQNQFLKLILFKYNLTSQRVINHGLALESLQPASPSFFEHCGWWLWQNRTRQNQRPSEGLFEKRQSIDTALVASPYHITMATSETIPESGPNYILNGLDNALYNVYSPMVNAKALWESLERKYKTEDAGSKKFVVGKFLDFKMVDSKTVISQVQEFQLILHDIHAEGMVLGESFQVAALIEKLPPTWKDFKNYLKHKRKEMKLEDLIVRLRIEEDNRQSEKKAGNYHQEAKANVVEQGPSKRRKIFESDGPSGASGSNSKGEGVPLMATSEGNRTRQWGLILRRVASINGSVRSMAVMRWECIGCGTFAVVSVPRGRPSTCGTVTGMKITQKTFLISTPEGHFAAQGKKEEEEEEEEEGEVVMMGRVIPL